MTVTDRFTQQHRKGCGCPAPDCQQARSVADAICRAVASLEQIARGEIDTDPGDEQLDGLCRQCLYWKRRDRIAGECWHETSNGTPKLEHESCRFFAAKVIRA